MRFLQHARFVCAAALLSACCGVSTGAAPQQDEELNVRGAFLTSRPGATNTNKAKNSRSDSNRVSTRPQTTRRRSPRSSGNNANQAPAQNETSTKPPATSGPNALAASSNPAATEAVGLGYTLYMRDPAGDPVRVDPSSEFRAGDRIRLVLEPNIDGFLYVFHTENDGPPQMLFPDSRLNDGANAVRAHVPYEVPSSRETDEQLRWFAFDNKSATEKLYVFVARQPIAGIPSAAELSVLCRAGRQCAWQPPAETWAQLKAAAGAPARVSQSETYGQKISDGEREATTRGLGLSAAAPEPSVVRMNVSAADGLLLTTVSLTHK